MERTVLGDRTWKYAPPPWRMFEALSAEVGEWIGDLGPTVLDAERPQRVVWGSPWPSRPDDTIEFLISPDGPGAAVRVVWRSTSPPDEALRYRLSQALGRDVREFVDLQG